MAEYKARSIKHKIFRAIIFLTVLPCAGCPSFSENSAPMPQEQLIQANPINFAISPGDWESNEFVEGDAKLIVRSVRKEKLDTIRKNFTAPSIHTMTVTESSPYSLYRIKGLPELSDFSFVHPRLFIATSTEKISISGFRTGERDSRGRELVSIAIPLALINGQADAISINGMGGSDNNNSLALPDSYKIADLAGLQDRIKPDKLETLPVCPTLFKLRHRSNVYYASSPFENISVCPINQFFKVYFKAPAEEMKVLLEDAAFQNGRVTLTADLSVTFAVPKKNVEVEMYPASFKSSLINELNQATADVTNIPVGASYNINTIERGIEKTFYSMIRQFSIKPEYSTEMANQISNVSSRFFDVPFSCGNGEQCRSILRDYIREEKVKYSWTEGESIALPLKTSAESDLGAVANSSKFFIQPARSALEVAIKPRYFAGKSIAEVAEECRFIEFSRDFTHLNPPFVETDREYVESYCRMVRPYSEYHNFDGYYPFGANTVAYPGAYIRIDFDRIEEFTKAKTKLDDQGNTILESEIKDMLAQDPNTNATTCIEGDRQACIKYKTKKIEVRDREGNHMQGEVSCQRGEPGCICRIVEGQSICSRIEYLFQEVMDYTCAREDISTSCPYFKEEEQVIDWEVETDCQSVKVGSHSSFLCLGGCGERYEMQCREKSRRPVTKTRKVLNCVEDNPASGVVNRLIQCKKPQYICEQWSVNCSRYNVNEHFQILHEEIAPKWRPFSLSEGERPPLFEQQIYLKFSSPRGTASNCKLHNFRTERVGNTWYIKLPNEQNDYQPCDIPLWNGENTQPGFLPVVYMKNDIRYTQERLCGITEYSRLAFEIPATGTEATIPQAYLARSTFHAGPVENSCHVPNKWLVNNGHDYAFIDVPMIRFSGRVAVLGRMLETILNGLN